MENRIIIKKLGVLSKPELKRHLNAVLDGPYKDDVKLLAAYFKKTIGKSLFEDDDVFAGVFGKNEAFSKTRLNKLMSDYNVAFDDFIVSELSHSNELEREIDRAFDVLKFYSHRKLEPESEKAIRKLKKKITQLPHQGVFYYDALYRITDFELSLKVSRKEIEIYQKLSDVHDLKYYHRKLIDWVTTANHEMLFSSKFEYRLKEEIISYLEEKPYGERPSLQIWLDAFKLSIDKTDHEKKQLLEKGLYHFSELLDPSEARDLFAVLFNSVLASRDGDEPETEAKLLEYLLFQLDKEIIYVDGFFPPIIFENIVNLAIKIKGPQWTKQFINNFGHRVLPELRKPSIRHGKAKCYFQENDFSNCLEELLKLKRHRFKKIYLDLAVRILRVKAYYEIDRKAKNYDRYQPERDLGALKKFLYMKKGLLSSFLFHERMEFIKITNRLCLCNELKKALKILEELKEKRTRVAERTWLLEKAEALVRELS